MKRALLTAATWFAVWPVATALAQDQIRLFKLVSPKDEVVIGLSADELRTFGPRPDLDNLAQHLASAGEMTVWQYAVRKDASGTLQQAPLRRIAIFRNDGITGCFAPEPAFEISGAGSRLNFSDGVAFVPPLNDHIAACNLASATISFYRKRSDSPLVFDQYPCFEVWQGLAEPDGLAFSPSGEWLAVANHGNHSVSIFERRNRVALHDKFRFGPAPSAVIADAGFRYPHSLRTLQSVKGSASGRPVDTRQHTSQGRRVDARADGAAPADGRGRACRGRDCSLAIEIGGTHMRGQTRRARAGVS